ncbi:phage portal protein [Planctomycetales bacterium ZRK34]|nr:phage portal protein [Planctomycetales bacterium ZRK34]
MAKWLNRIMHAFGYEARSTAGSTQVNSHNHWLINMSDAAGVEVNADTVLGMAVAYAAIRNISEDIAGLPLHRYRRLERGRELADDSSAITLLQGEPNQYMHGYTFRETMTAQALLYHNAYAVIKRDSHYNIIGYIPLWTPLVDVYRTEGGLVYEVRTYEGSPTSETYTSDEILHLQGISFSDGLTGDNPIVMLRKTIAVAMATEQFAERYFANNATLGGVFSVADGLGDDAQRHLKEQLEELHTGYTNAFKVLVAEQGATFTQFNSSADGAQLIEARKFHVANIARLYRIPPHMIGDLDRATNNNIEQQSIDYVKHTLRPWLTRWEYELNAKSLTESDKRLGYYFKHSVEGFLRGDSEARREFYTAMFNIGVYSQNDIRELEDDAPIEGGDTYYVPLNMIPIDAYTAGSAPEPAAADDGGQRARDIIAINRKARAKASVIQRARTTDQYRKLFADAANRIISRERNEVERASKKYLPEDVKGFQDWLEQFYQKHETAVADIMRPPMESYGEAVHGIAAEDVDGNAQPSEGIRQFISAYVATYAVSHVISSKRQLLDVSGSDNPLDAVVERLQEWVDKRGQKITQKELVKMKGAVVRETYKTNGVTHIIWRNVGSENCPICTKLDGKTIGIEKEFFNEGDSIEAEGQEPIVFKSSIRHPPAHGGCNCEILPG